MPTKVHTLSLSFLYSDTELIIQCNAIKIQRNAIKIQRNAIKIGCNAIKIRRKVIKIQRDAIKIQCNVNAILQESSQQTLLCLIKSGQYVGLEPPALNKSG